ncbi:MAG: septum formation protein Maf [Ruminococcus sp.]|nr:septum formation protein Maf [Ruminococcus sp.]
MGKAKIILASGSPRRRELMKLITDDFTAVSVNADETLPEGIPPENAAEFLSAVKAEAAALRYPDCLVIGCDTVVVAEGRILGKPADKAQCREFMELLSDNGHQVYTGCTMIYGGKKHSFSSCTLVRFRELSDEEIEEYISTDEPYDKAGGYGIQGKAALFTDYITGDFYNVVGLPVSRLSTELKRFRKEQDI